VNEMKIKILGYKDENEQPILKIDLTEKELDKKFLHVGHLKYIFFDVEDE